MVLAQTWHYTNVNNTTQRPPKKTRTRRRWLAGLSGAAVLLLTGALLYSTLLPHHIHTADAAPPATDSPSAAEYHSPTSTAAAPPSSPQSITSTPPSATRVLTFQPWTPSGLSPQVTATTAPGSCWTTSSAAVRAGAYRCMIGNEIHDPCFSSPIQIPPTQVACPYPDVNHLTVIDLTQPLPTAASGSPGDNAPWLIVLADGQRCNFATGTSVTIGKMRANYLCPNGSGYGYPDTNKPTWTIHYQAKDNNVLETIPLTTVYE